MIDVEVDAENLIKYLLGKGADVNAIDNDGDTPLHWCAKIGNWTLKAQNITWKIEQCPIVNLHRERK